MNEMTQEKLIEFLKAGNVSINEWGKGEAKTIEHLLEEINSGEAEISYKDGKILRIAYGAVLDVYYRDGNRILKLKELKQVFKDGRERSRSLDVSIGEKMKPDEHSLDAVNRALREELQITEKLYLVAMPLVVKGPVPSVSFPGLLTKYIMHAWYVYLPKHLYKPEGYIEEQSDKTNYFVWEEVKK